MANNDPHRNRDAGTGRFVTDRYTDRHPKTTVRETVKPSKPSPSPKPKGK